MSGPGVISVVVLLRDGHYLQQADLPVAIAVQMKQDLEHWLLGSRTFSYLDEHGARREIAAAEIAGVALYDPSQPEDDPDVDRPAEDLPD
ncbi:MAG: hypothetical protein H0V44_08740 [Planctomycetes bacterium]|nr:hypothetical protein [Planctomycetota bacterium]